MKLNGTTLLYQTSPDGATWTTIFASVISGGNIFVDLHAYLRMYNATGASKTAKFDDFEIKDFSNS
jgi:hypothetical protein